MEVISKQVGWNEEFGLKITFPKMAADHPSPQTAPNCLIRKQMLILPIKGSEFERSIGIIFFVISINRTQ